MNQLDQLIRELEGADYYHDEEETRWPLWQEVIPAMFGGLGLFALAAWAVWRHFAG